MGGRSLSGALPQIRPLIRRGAPRGRRGKRPGSQPLEPGEEEEEEEGQGEAGPGPRGSLPVGGAWADAGSLRGWWGEERGYTPPASTPLSLSTPHFLPLCPAPAHWPYIPVALSNLGRKPFQKAQAWARSPRRTSRGRRFRLTYCCATPVYCGHCGALGSRGSLGSLCKKGKVQPQSSLPRPEVGDGDGEEAAGASRPHALSAPRGAHLFPPTAALTLLSLLQYPSSSAVFPFLLPSSCLSSPFPSGDLPHYCLCFSHLKI